jgi:hypothetical protein
MVASFHEPNHLGKAIEARPLDRPQWMLFAECHDLSQLLEAADAEFLTITMIPGDLAASEELVEPLKNRDIPLVLDHAELWKDLPANFHRGLPVDADEEATLSIDKPDDPFGTQAFLLIVCTGRIVTHG